MTMQHDIQRCPVLWFEDGTVVLESNGTAFRVYFGLLAQNSSVFREMFSFPQPKEEDMCEGCPLVHMPDSPIDLMYFLRAIHDPSYDLHEITDINIIASVLRLSTKYDVPYLRKRSIKPLAYLYPSQLKDWDIQKSKPSKLTVFPGRASIVVQLAKECDVPSLLPTALLRCCINEVASTVDGVTAPDRITHLELNAADKRQYLLSRVVVDRAAHQKTYSFLCYEVDFSGCTTPGMCGGARLEYLRRLERRFSEGRCWDPVTALLRLWVKFKRTACSWCYDTSIEKFNQQRTMVWNELPSMLGLGTWDEVRDKF